jgi:DNA-binding IclR family transcriptional regulator
MSTNTSSLHVFQILRLVAEGREPKGVADISKEMGLPTTTVYRALVTLTEARYLARDEGTAKYRVGQMPLMLLRALCSRFPLRELAMPALRALASDTGETVSLSMRLGWYGVRIASVPGSNDTQYKPRVGLCQLMHRSRAQSLMLASLSETHVQGYRRFVRKHYSDYASDVDRTAFAKELRTLHDRGFSTQPSALGTGFHCALPIRLKSGEAVAIYHINGPVLESADSAPEARLKRWMKVRDGTEKLLNAAPEKYQNPFSHVDPDDILLRITA